MEQSLKYLVFVENDIEPETMGPYPDEDARDDAALELRRERGPDHGIFVLDIEPGAGVPAMAAYSGGFFTEEP